MSDPRKPFLTAQWRELAMLNFEVAADFLDARVPAGTELDADGGRTWISLVGFMFRDTRLFGVPIPFHRTFEEVNLRFYVRRKSHEGWRRGVVFVKELVPRRAISSVARWLYNEPYTTLPMSHRIEVDGARCLVRYAWRRSGREECMSVNAEGELREIGIGSREEFLSERAWGYTRQRDGSTLEYHVEHPRWKFRPARETQLECDVRELYGPEFGPLLARPPDSAFLAEGSAVRLHRGVKL